MTGPWRFAVLGDPISHSRSPAIHTEALRIAGFEGSYEAIRADAARLEEVVAEMVAGEFQGLNVTMPLKEAAATIAGSSQPVNTLRVEDGQVAGVSTDRLAFRELLQLPGISEMGSVLLLGTGGSAKSFLPELSDRVVYVSGRSEEKARRLADTHENATWIPWGAGVVGALVVNSTPVGMGGEKLPLELLSVAEALIDLPYGPAVTPAVRDLRKRGKPVIDGFDFLARQAAGSFQWWTGVAVDSEPLARVARNV